jgi:hypothetical protein
MAKGFDRRGLPGNGRGFVLSFVKMEQIAIQVLIGELLPR